MNRSGALAKHLRRAEANDPAVGEYRRAGHGGVCVVAGQTAGRFGRRVFVQETIAEIAQQPLACPAFDTGNVVFKVPIRWLGTGRFPYLVIFTVQADEIAVVAILHAHRDLETVLASRIGKK